MTKAIEGLNSIQPQFLYNPDEMQEVFEEKIEEASYTIRNKKANYLKKWWNGEIQQVYNEKREKLKNYNKSKTLKTQLELQKTRAIFKRMVRKEKRRYEREMKEKIDEQTPPKQIWNIIRGLNSALTGSKRGAEHNPEQKTAENFVKSNYKEKQGELRYTTRQLAETNSTQEALSFEEFQRILRGKKDHSSPGLDNISYRILKNLKLDILCEVCNQLNIVWRTKKIPEKWRTSKLVLIQKPNKDPDDIASKRGIVLMNVFLKIINTFVKDRLYKFAEEQNLDRKSVV